MREQLSIPRDAFVLTTIGTICRRKRQKWALYALRYLVQKKIDAYYLLVGAPSEKGGQGDPEYVVEFLNSVRKFDLQSRVRGGVATRSGKHSAEGDARRCKTGTY